MNIHKILIPSFIFASVVGLRAEVTPSSIFCDGMIVQRESPLVIWGSAEPNENVEIKIDGRIVAEGKANSDGSWKITAAPLKAGGPYTLEVNDTEIHGVLSGDVLLCSGQSNMELPVRRVMDMWGEEVENYTNDQIRQYVVPKEFEFEGPLSDTKKSAWQPIDAAHVGDFSALAYFTAKELNRRTGLPVGIINASWGGTPIEAWISEEVLQENYPYAVAQKSIYNDAQYRQQIKDLEGQNYAHWNSTLYMGDKGVSSPVRWFDPEFDDKDWKSVDLLSSEWATDGLNPINGSHWFRKALDLPCELEGSPAVLRMGCIVDADSVYVNGVFVGNTTYQYPPRIYNVPSGLLKAGENCITVRLLSQQGAPHFVAEKPYKLIVDGHEFSLEGDWKYHLGCRMPAGPSMMFYCYVPAVLFNGMIAPVIKYPVAGTVWYQGESNVGRRNEYPMLMQLLANDWRTRAGDSEMPLYIVELADFLHPSDISGRNAWAEMRQQQARGVEAISNATLIRNSDLGEWNDIHPLDKKTLGIRVADAIYSDLNHN